MKHLTAKQIADFEALLKGRGRVLAAELRGEISDANAQRSAQAGEGALDQADRAQLDSVTVQETGMVGHYAVELADVDAALARIADGSYGECIDCGSEVPYARLLAHPTAKRCVACQEVREHKRKTGAA
jgi:RNA polymerase-binding transcription factor DksA